MSAAKTIGSQSAPGTLNATSLFPFWSPSTAYTNNYQLWAGKCEQEQPLTPPTGTDTATVGPGAAVVSTSAGMAPTVAMPAVDVAAKWNGTPVTPAVKITFTGSGAGGACSDTWQNVPPAGTEIAGGVTYGVYPAPFASTAAAGQPTASASGDPGTISVCVQYTNGSQGTRHETVGPLTNTNFTAPTRLSVIDVKTDSSSTTNGCP